MRARGLVLSRSSAGISFFRPFWGRRARAPLAPPGRALGPLVTPLLPAGKAGRGPPLLSHRGLRAWDQAGWAWRAARIPAHRAHRAAPPTLNLLSLSLSPLPHPLAIRFVLADVFATLRAEDRQRLLHVSQMKRETGGETTAPPSHITHAPLSAHLNTTSSPFPRCRRAPATPSRPRTLRSSSTTRTAASPWTGPRSACAARSA